MQKHRMRVASAALAALALAALVLAGSASAKLPGEWARFAPCPYKNPEASKCILATTVGGEVVLGSKKVPIVNPAVLQGAYTEGDASGNSKFLAPTSGPALSKAPQPVPGGLAGLVNCKEISNFLLRVSCEVTFENGVTGLNSTLELARPATEIVVNENNLAGETGTALKLPIKIHLENPFLGSSCYVGSSSSPIYWNLTSGTTSPPPPNKPIKGTAGALEFLEEGSILETKGTKLVDNAWAAPGVNGCGGIFSLILNPIINSAAGLPAAAGRNTAILVNNTFIASALAVNFINEENP
ncbi:MAG: hypothetical protein QOF13_1519 [Solirubrobacterales bacterium]|nr:hypothetical protein [Solirubrobacterales bacterium]